MKTFSFLTNSACTVRIALERPPKAAAIYYRFTLYGRRHYKTTKTLDARQARRIAEGAANQAAVHGPGHSISVLVQQYLAVRWPGGTDSENDSGSDARCRLQGFVEYSGQIVCLSSDAGAMTDLIQRYVDKRLADRLEGQTIKNDQTVLSAFFAWCKRKFRLWQYNPATAENLTLPKVTKRDREPLAYDSIVALLDVARDSELYPVLVLLLCGCRPRGAMRLTWEDIDLTHRLVKPTEKRVERVIPLGAWACAELFPLHWISTGKIWRYHHDTAHDELARIRKAHGLPKTLTLQALRRACEMQLWDSDVSPQRSAKIMGHSVVTAEKHYIKLAAMRAHQAAEHLDWSPKPSENSSEESYKSLRPRSSAG